MTDEQYEKAEEIHNSIWSNEVEDYKAVEINKAINITNAIAKVIEAGKRDAIVQVQDFDEPEYDCDHYDEEGQHGPSRRY